MPDWEELMAGIERAGWRRTGPSRLSAASRGLPVPPSKPGERGRNEALPFLLCCGFLLYPSPLFCPLHCLLSRLRPSTGPSVQCPLIDRKQDALFVLRRSRWCSAGAFSGSGVGLSEALQAEGYLVRQEVSSEMEKHSTEAHCVLIGRILNQGTV